jgi:hypothetical protein
MDGNVRSRVVPLAEAQGRIPGPPGSHFVNVLHRGTVRIGNTNDQPQNDPESPRRKFWNFWTRPRRLDQTQVEQVFSGQAAAHSSGARPCQRPFAVVAAPHA